MLGRRGNNYLGTGDLDSECLVSGGCNHMDVGVTYFWSSVL